MVRKASFRSAATGVKSLATGAQPGSTLNTAQTSWGFIAKEQNEGISRWKIPKMTVRVEPFLLKLHAQAEDEA